MIIKERKHQNNEPRVAKKDIRCYKILCFDKDINKYYTPVMHVEVTSNTLECESFSNEPTNNKVHHGIHTFRNIFVCFMDFLTIQIFDMRTISIKIHICIKRSIIPKGTRYWVGKGGCYCSERIIIKGLNI